MYYAYDNKGTFSLHPGKTYPEPDEEETENRRGGEYGGSRSRVLSLQSGEGDCLRGECLQGSPRFS